MRSNLTTYEAICIAFVFGILAGCVDVTPDESSSKSSSSTTSNPATSNTTTSPQNQAGTDELRHPVTGEVAVIYKPLTTDLGSSPVYRNAGSTQPASVPVSPDEQQAIQYLADEVGLIVSAKEIGNMISNPGYPYPKIEKLSDEQAVAISKLPNLEWIELGSADLSDSSLQNFSELTKLKYLDLSKNEKISDEGLKHLSGLNLVFLDLSGCSGITDEGLKALSGLTSLRHLRLRNCDGLSEDGLKYLANLTNLEELNVSSDNFKGFGIAHLKPLPSLKHLGIANESNKLSVDELRQNLPDFKSLKRLFVQRSLTNEQFVKLVEAFPDIIFR